MRNQCSYPICEFSDVAPDVLIFMRALREKYVRGTWDLVAMCYILRRYSDCYSNGLQFFSSYVSESSPWTVTSHQSWPCDLLWPEGRCECDRSRILNILEEYSNIEDFLLSLFPEPLPPSPYEEAWASPVNDEKHDPFPHLLPVYSQSNLRSFFSSFEKKPCLSEEAKNKGELFF